MPKYLTCESALDCSMPNIHRLTAQLRTMHDGHSPVTARALAQAFGLFEEAIMPVLRRAEQAGMIQNFQCRGWIPVTR